MRETVRIAPPFPVESFGWRGNHFELFFIWNKYWRLLQTGMNLGNRHGQIIDLGRVKIHGTTGHIGKVVDEVSPRDQRFSQYRLVLELADGTREEFLFLELRDATEVEIARYTAEMERVRAQKRC
jgi:hypothetical protein